MTRNVGNGAPLGVRLCDVALMLQPTSVRTELKGNVLLVHHEHYATRIEVVPPEHRESWIGVAQAVVRVTTDLPDQLAGMLDEPLSAVPMNAFAALGALYSEQGRTRVGSRLTIFEDEGAWPTLHLPLLAFTALSATEAILGGMRRTFTGQSPSGGASQWTAADIGPVKSVLSRRFLCTTGDGALTAEFPLANGPGTAVLGDPGTALFQLDARQPHPELGGGLLVLLQLPHSFRDETHVHEMCHRLNGLEMSATALPPHFGAWCAGRREHNVAYISFLPNVLHEVAGIALNAATWALHRARWANGILREQGVRL